MTQAEAKALLAECRRKIDALDLELRELLNRRAGIVDDVVHAKEALAMEGVLGMLTADDIPGEPPGFAPSLTKEGRARSHVHHLLSHVRVPPLPPRIDRVSTCYWLGPWIVPAATGGVIQIKTRTLTVTRKDSPAHAR